MKFSKRHILDALIATIESEIAARIRNAEATTKGATHEEARPENDKDTRALEATYLARGQAMRVEELQDALAKIRFLNIRDFEEDELIDIGALVTLETDGELAHLLLIPEGGGRVIEIDGQSIKVINPASPLGRALVDKRVGDEFELPLGGRIREYEVVRVD